MTEPAHLERAHLLVHVGVGGHVPGPPTEEQHVGLDDRLDDLLLVQRVVPAALGLTRDHRVAQGHIGPIEPLVRGQRPHLVVDPFGQVGDLLLHLGRQHALDFLEGAQPVEEEGDAAIGLLGAHQGQQRQGFFQGEAHRRKEVAVGDPEPPLFRVPVVGHAGELKDVQVAEHSAPGDPEVTG